MLHIDTIFIEIQFFDTNKSTQNDKRDSGRIDKRNEKKKKIQKQKRKSLVENPSNQSVVWSESSFNKLMI